MQITLAAFLRNTPDGKEAQSIVQKCVHCGFCTATCPTYQLLGDELDGPRGRIYLMKQVLEGQLWDEATLQRACTVLMNEFTPISDMRASAAYRAQLCVNLLRRFWLETSPCSSARDIPVTLSGFQTQGAKP